jgi:nicotinamidase-related amidase
MNREYVIWDGVMIALLIIDMQEVLFQGEPARFDAAGVIQRIDRLAAAVRAARGMVVFIQHEDKGAFKPGTEGWEILPALTRLDADVVVGKRACDAFYETGLDEMLTRAGVRQVIVTGCATDFCVDTTIRAAASRDFEVVVATDGHTTKDRPHLGAQAIIQHHNWMWANLILPEREVSVMPTVEILAWLESPRPDAEGANGSEQSIG